MVFGSCFHVGVHVASVFALVCLAMEGSYQREKGRITRGSPGRTRLLRDAKGVRGYEVQNHALHALV